MSNLNRLFEEMQEKNKYLLDLISKYNVPAYEARCIVYGKKNVEDADRLENEANEIPAMSLRYEDSKKEIEPKQNS